MARLTEENLEVGRDFLRNRNLDGFVSWIKDNHVLVNLGMAKSTFDACLKADDIDRALRIFDRVFVGMNPTVDKVRLWATRGVLLVVALGIVGGLVALFR